MMEVNNWREVTQDKATRRREGDKEQNTNAISCMEDK